MDVQGFVWLRPGHVVVSLLVALLILENQQDAFVAGHV